MTTRIRIGATAASAVLAAALLTGCGPNADDCDTNSSAQTFAKPGGGGGGRGGGGSKGGKGGSKSKPKPGGVHIDTDDDCDEDN